MAGDFPRVVTLTVFKGLKLAKKDIFGASDPYVIVSVLNQDTGDELEVARTIVCKRTLNPTWNEDFEFHVETGNRRCILLQVFDENRLTRDDFLGLVEIPLDCIQEDHVIIPAKDYLLRPRSARSRVKGYLRLRIAYHIAGASEQYNINDDTQHTEEEQALADTNNEGSSDFIANLDLNDVREVVNDSNFTSVGDVVNETDLETARERLDTSTVEEVVVDSISQPTEEFPATFTGNDEIDSSEERPARTNSTYGRDRSQSLASHVSVATISAEEPMPSGWEARVDATGRTFYIDHITRRTQWERPSRTNALDLPSGWEERQDYNGRTYYVNHATRVTQWQRPTAETTSESESERQNQQQQEHTAGLANMYRNRRHISQEDTVDVVSTPTSAPSTPVIETPGDVEATAEEEPLGAGWAIAQTPSGRTFYIDHNTRKTTWIHPSRLQADDTRLEVPESPVTRASSNEDLLRDLGRLPAGWEERVHTDGRIFYVNHMSRLTQWEDPRLEKYGGPAVPYSRDYKQKYDYFRSKLRKPQNVPNKIDIKIRRNRILEDSFNIVTGVKKADLLKTRLWIEFEGETGLDYGGVSREWFYLLSKEMFNPYYGLFEYSATDDYTLQINPNSGLANESHISYFKFIGRVAGMAVYHGKLLDGFFIRPFYKMMLGKNIVLRDMESVDSEYYNSLVWILENDPHCLELTFSVDEELYGETVERELMTNGKDVPVTDRNKRQYIDLVIKWRFIERIKRQMIAFMDGFNDLVPHELIQIFDENELELLMCGLQDIDVKDWKTHSVYKGEYNPNHPVIVNFWRACYSFNNEMRSRLLQFVTGTSRVPMNGFQELHGSNGPQLFTIEKWGKQSQLPRAHTCFNRLDLPPYSSYDELRKKLLMAVESTEGFEGVD